LKEIHDKGHIALWWSKRPAGVETTIAQLRSRIASDGYFNLYYTKDRKARYRARVIDLATEEDYNADSWRQGRNVAWLQETFDGYRGEGRSGKPQQARIVFLVDRMARLDPEISISKFRFINGPDGLTQDNMQPYSKVMKEPEWSGVSEPVAAYGEQDLAIREAFKKYLLDVVGASANTVDQYIGSMARLQRWFIEHGAASATYRIWTDHSANSSIQSHLDGPSKEEWTAHNKRQNNTLRVPWNHWNRFLQSRIEKVMHFASEHRAILCALKTKPFVLLAGISGTGKSRLVRTLAYQTCSPELQGKRPGNYALIMVKPNWHDPTELVGYVSRIGEKPRYVVTEFLRFLVKAWQHPGTPFFLCLDEMNLAPVEQYFADYLSVVETRRTDEAGQVITDALLSVDHVEDAVVFRDALLAMGLEQDAELMDRFMRDGITLPPNLVVMGTVNMDETTHSFSRKVLDRAMTFEMNHVDLRAGLGEQDVQWSYPELPLSADLALGRITRGGDVPQSFAGAEEVLKWLEQLNGVLDGTPFKVAYRVRDEALIYAYHNSGLSNKPSDWLQQCLDEMMVMKVLSRIEGDAGRVGEVLTNLMNMLPENWKQSRKKIAEMQHKLTFGYTSFWS